MLKLIELGAHVLSVDFVMPLLTAFLIDTMHESRKVCQRRFNSTLTMLSLVEEGIYT